MYKKINIIAYKLKPALIKNININLKIIKKKLKKVKNSKKIKNKIIAIK